MLDGKSKVLILRAILQTFQNSIKNCNGLIAEAFTQNDNGEYIISKHGRDMLTKTAFLDLYIAWEAFLEESFEYYLMGGATIGGTMPVTLYKSSDISQIRKMMAMLGNERFFDYTIPDKVVTVAKLLFKDGYPYANNINSARQALQDLKTMRNAAAHMSQEATHSFNGLVQRTLTVPHAGMDLSTFLLAHTPMMKESSDNRVFAYYQSILNVAANGIANG